MTRTIAIMAALLTVSLTTAAYLLLHEESGATVQASWSVKKEEVRNRLLSVPIILYHNIDGKGPYSIDSVSLREQFEEIRRQEIRVVSLEELVRRLQDGEPFQGKVLVITFDDGYLSNYHKLLPLIKEFAYPVTLFVYTDFISRKSSRRMTWDKLRELERAGVSIQCHSRSHPDLTRMTGNDRENRHELYREMYLSRRIIELYLDKEVTFFAFPYGRYDLELVDLAGGAGYSRVFSTDYGTNLVTRNNFCLRRHHIKSDYSLERFRKIID